MATEGQMETRRSTRGSDLNGSSNVNPHDPMIASIVYDYLCKSLYHDLAQCFHALTNPPPLPADSPSFSQVLDFYQRKAPKRRRFIFPDSDSDVEQPSSSSKPTKRKRAPVKRSKSQPPSKKPKQKSGRKRKDPIEDNSAPTPMDVLEPKFSNLGLGQRLGTSTTTITSIVSSQRSEEPIQDTPRVMSISDEKKQAALAAEVRMKQKKMNEDSEEERRKRRQHDLYREQAIKELQAEQSDRESNEDQGQKSLVDGE